MWPKLVAEAKDGGADCIETYVFWNGHEIAPGQVRRLLLNKMLFFGYFTCEECGFLYGGWISLDCSTTSRTGLTWCGL
jgi:hypothetical protein